MDGAVILELASAFVAGAMACAVAVFARRSIPRWFFVAGMATLATESVFSWLSVGAILPAHTVYWQDWRLVALSFLPGLWLFFSLSYSRGNYREFLAKWRSILIASFLLPISLTLWFRRSLIVSIRPTASGNAWVLGLGFAGTVLTLLFLLSAVLVLMNLERTYRASVGTMRWRIKFMILGLAVLFAVRAYTSSQVLLFHGIDISLQSVNSVALLVAGLLIVRSLMRTGHFDVTVYPSHSLLQNSLTVVLAGVYLLIVGVFAKVVEYLGGDTSFALKAFLILVAVALLAILVLSDRVRLRTNRFVSRHLRRPLHDYRMVWKRFTEDTASRMEQTELCRAVVTLVADVFQVLSVTLWLADEKREKLTVAASTSRSETRKGGLSQQGPQVVEVIGALRSHPELVDFDASRESWAALLRQWHPDEFHKGGSRVAVPIINAGEILGVITVGDRVSGVPFLQQDFDLLKCIADQVAAGLRNAQLSQKLLQARELEAFQNMSAFFVHDLKNTASTMNLMLQNLPVHFDDPAFREDALRGISKTVDHINDLIGRLSLLRAELEIRLAEVDLNEVVTTALVGWEKTADVDLVKDLHPLPKVSLDGEQIGKVVTNLVLNAREAVSGKGHVHIETTQRNGWVVLAVADDGCGMSAEFLDRSLFRPFQTTKKRGLGIGMFQSKMIVEAHGGRIEVESEQGKGSTFRVLLPVQP